MACLSTKVAISLKCIKIEEKLLWRCHVRVLSPIYFPSMCVARHAFLDHPVASSVHSGVTLTGTLALQA